MFNALKIILAKVRKRIERSQAHSYDESIIPEIIPFPSHDSDDGYSGSNNSNWTDDASAPGERQDQYINFTTTDRNGRVRSSSEDWHPDGNVMKVEKVTDKMESCSGTVIPPRAIAVVCSVSGKHTDKYFRCSRCGCTLCEFHAQALRTRYGVLVLCPKHLKRERHDTWNGPAGTLISLPEKPFSASALLTIEGKSNEQETEQ